MRPRELIQRTSPPGRMMRCSRRSAPPEAGSSVFCSKPRTKSRSSGWMLAPPMIVGGLVLGREAPDLLLPVRPVGLARLDVPLPDAEAGCFHGERQPLAVVGGLFRPRPLRCGALLRLTAGGHPFGDIDGKGQDAAFGGNPVRDG